MSRTVNLFSSLVEWHQISRYFRDSCSVKILLTFNFLFITFFTTTAQDSNLINTKKDTSDNIEYPNKKEFRERITDPNHYLLAPKQIKKRVKTKEDAIELIKDAKIITESGLFSIVLEMISSQVAKNNNRKNSCTNNRNRFRKRL